MKQFFTKRRILMIVVIVLVLAIVALLLLPGGTRRDQSFQGGEDTPYPFEWTEKQDGSILLSLCRQVPEGCLWRFAQEASDAVAVSKEEKGEGSVFRVQPLRTGDVLLRFLLADESFPEDCCCELLLTAEIRAEAEELKASVSGNRMILTGQALRGGESFDCPYRIRTDEEDRLAVFLLDGSTEPDWQLFQRNRGDVLRLAGRKTENGILSLRFYGNSAGTSRLLLYSVAKRLTLELTIISDAEGQLTVQSHEMAAHPEWEGMEDEELDAFVVAGEIHTPEGAENLRYQRRTIGKQTEAAVVSFRYLDVDWTVYITAGSELEALVAKEFENDRLLTLAVSGHAMHACFREEEGIVTAWCSVEGQWFLFEGTGEPDLARLLDTANAMIAEMKE
ncbi:MAG: hypothetical protein IKO00_17175 [Oscillospiraceae bacterium]|nr:hypothetical protein [Oscillospiraceae bacterium]